MQCSAESIKDHRNQQNPTYAVVSRDDPFGVWILLIVFRVITGLRPPPVLFVVRNELIAGVVSFFIMDVYAYKVGVSYWTM